MTSGVASLDRARTPRRLDVPLILALGATGIVPASLFLLPFHSMPLELAAWTVLAAAVWVPLAVRRGVSHRILTMVLVGLVAGVATGAVQAPLAHVMFENDADLAAQYGGEATLAVRLIIFAIDVAIGLVWGLLVGAVWWLGAFALARARGRTGGTPSD